MIEGLQLSIPQRLAFVKTTLLLSLLISVFLSFNLWTGERDFPFSPVFDYLVLPSLVSNSLLGLLVVFILAALFLNYQRVYIAGVVVLVAFLMLADVTRCQPWCYIYVCMLSVFVFYDGRVDNSNKFTSYHIILQLILASVYFYNGISAINPDFVERSFVDMIWPIKSIMSERQFLFFVKAGKIVPYLLIFIGIGFSISSIRFLVIALAILLHVFLLVLLFPSASHQNYALWFANIPFLVLLLLLFSGQIKDRYFSLAVLFQRLVFYPVFTFLLVLPVTNSFGFWPDFLSANFRSGNNFSVKLSLSEMAYTRLPANLKQYCFRENFDYRMDVEKWCLTELKSDCFPHKLVFEQLEGYVVQKTGLGEEEVNLVKLPPHRLLLKR